MTDTVWIALALARQAVRAEILENENASVKQENAALKDELDGLKKLHQPEQPKETDDVDVT